MCKALLCAIAIVAALGLSACVSPTARSFLNQSKAMEPTLKIGDRILVETASYVSTKPKDGDIIVFYPPHELGTVPFIKRIIASPHESLSMRHGKVVTNGRAASEPFIEHQADYDLEVRNYQIYVDAVPLDPTKSITPTKSAWQSPDRVPDGYFVVLGDNRNDSNDSHLWGFLKRSQIIGRVQSIYWPLDRITKL